MLNTDSHIDVKSYNKSKYSIIAIVTISCILMYFVDGHIKPDYQVKSLIKIILFFIIPCIYCYFDKNISLKSYFAIHSKKQAALSLLLGFSVYFFILIAYFITQNFIELNQISDTLTTSSNIDSGNFIFIAIYIALVNSLLEEFFFRGFAFLSLTKFTSPKLAFVFSSLLFSLYHVAIMIGWFNIFIFSAILIGLAIAGVIFNYLNYRSKNIYNSWLVHMFANFSINTIGLIMFSII